MKDRNPAVAGSFYPGDAQSLNNHLAALFNSSDSVVEKNMAALIVPHAGYVFSGEVAAAGYKKLDPGVMYENIFIIGSSHTKFFSGASIYNAGNYITPLASATVNTKIANTLINENSFIHFDPDVHAAEHSLEVQLPFLQYHLNNIIGIVPIVVGGEDPDTPKELANVLRPWFNEKNLFIISTDFSHYPKYSDAVILDSKTADAIMSNDPEVIREVCRKNRDSDVVNLSTGLCGESSVLVLTYLTQCLSNIRYDRVSYANSGDSDLGDHDRVVGYWAISVSRESRSGFSLSEEEKGFLLKLARESIESYLKTGTIPDSERNFSESLNACCGAFVTLNKGDKLQGCIGRLTSNVPLHDLICDMAIAAATEDVRFSKTTLEDMQYVEIEISVLTPLRRIDSIDELELGRHGVYVCKGSSSGTFLPQVATHTGWSKEEFLGHCARDKVGIGWNGWKDADVYVYEAIVFCEK